MHFYNYDYYLNLEIEYWQRRLLRFYDAFPALCYAHGIDISRILYWMLHEPKVRPGWVIEQQIQIIQESKTRTPKKVFEIGAGRGELTCTLQHLGIDTGCCETNEDAKEWFIKTGLHFFGHEFRPRLPIMGAIQNLDIDWQSYDTIIMVECLEHIREQDFQKVWNKIVTQFKGRFIVTNNIYMHPIHVGGNWKYAELEHCRLIDDSVYDDMSAAAKSVIVRQGSHLVLDFN